MNEQQAEDFLKAIIETGCQEDALKLTNLTRGKVEWYRKRHPHYDEKVRIYFKPKRRKRVTYMLDEERFIELYKKFWSLDRPLRIMKITHSYMTYYREQNPEFDKKIRELVDHKKTIENNGIDISYEYAIDLPLWEPPPTAMNWNRWE